MKIVFTISDFGAAANIGGDTERKSMIVDVPDELIPLEVSKYLEGGDSSHWQTLSLSLLVESTNNSEVDDE
jgi:hypothetical protein